MSLRGKELPIKAAETKLHFVYATANKQPYTYKTPSLRRQQIQSNNLFLVLKTNKKITTQNSN